MQKARVHKIRDDDPDLKLVYSVLQGGFSAPLVAEVLRQIAEHAEKVVTLTACPVRDPDSELFRNAFPYGGVGPVYVSGPAMGELLSAEDLLRYYILPYFADMIVVPQGADGKLLVDAHEAAVAHAAAGLSVYHASGTSQNAPNERAANMAEELHTMLGPIVSRRLNRVMQ